MPTVAVTLASSATFVPVLPAAAFMAPRKHPD
jgi:hypothetical protein